MKTSKLPLVSHRSVCGAVGSLGFVGDGEFFPVKEGPVWGEGARSYGARKGDARCASISWRSGGCDRVPWDPCGVGKKRCHTKRCFQKGSGRWLEKSCWPTPSLVKYPHRWLGVPRLTPPPPPPFALRRALAGEPREHGVKGADVGRAHCVLSNQTQQPLQTINYPVRWRMGMKRYETFVRGVATTYLTPPPGSWLQASWRVSTDQRTPKKRFQFWRPNPVRPPPLPKKNNSQQEKNQSTFLVTVKPTHGGVSIIWSNKVSGEVHCGERFTGSKQSEQSDKERTESDILESTKGDFCEEIYRWEIVSFSLWSIQVKQNTVKLRTVLQILPPPSQGIVSFYLNRTKRKKKW